MTLLSLSGTNCVTEQWVIVETQRLEVEAVGKNMGYGMGVLVDT